MVMVWTGGNSAHEKKDKFKEYYGRGNGEPLDLNWIRDFDANWESYKLLALLMVMKILRESMIGVLLCTQAPR